MYTSSASRVLTAAAFLVALGIVTGPVFAEETGADIPKDSYYDDPLTNTERDAIAEEENVSPNDGTPSVPDPQDQAIIPDSADPEVGDTTVAAPPSGDLPGDVSTGKPGDPARQSESEADVIIDDSKKNFRVTENELKKCLGDWDPETQMTKEEWEQSCRTTLQYFPEGQH